MVMRDFKEKNHNLILLRPSKEVLKSIQSLSEETIRVVNTDAEMIAALKEWNTIKRTQEIGAELLDMSNGKPTSATKNENTSTKL